MGKEVNVNLDSVIKNHYTHGEMDRFITEGSVANIVEEAWGKQTAIQKHRHMDRANDLAEKLEEKLQQFGVTDLKLVDKNKDGQFGKGDEIQVRVKERVANDSACYVGNVTHTEKFGAEHNERGWNKPQPKPQIENSQVESKTQTENKQDAASTSAAPFNPRADLLPANVQVNLLLEMKDITVGDPETEINKKQQNQKKHATKQSHK
ncbi:MAG: hypothetical protein K2X77_02850 [Candidatus Obscuribacterales bacterium]|jgi:hypothetical protein|nr:hypothetical protein [Candidatus Obscuribacterales bacterium]